MPKKYPSTPAATRFAARTTWLACFGVLVLLPIVAGALDTSDLSCTRVEGGVTCLYLESLLGMERERLLIPGVTGARVEVSRSGKGNSESYRAVLLVAGRDEVPLTSSYNYNHDRHAELAQRVNDFVSGPVPVMALRQAGWGWHFVLGTSTVLLGVAIFLRRRWQRAAASAESVVAR